jgi:hypothetical protein
MISADEFVLRFFGDGNGIWPGADPSHFMTPHLAPFLEVLAYAGECPVMLPRQRIAALPNEWYVIARDTAHAGRVRSLLEAAVAHSWVPFDGRVVTLDPGDPVHRAILDFRGPSTTFVLKPKSVDAEKFAVRALRRLAASLGRRPLRVASVPRPVGRMLREFDLALATGSAEKSAALLDEIESIGGISHENVAFLRVRRLARLGREAELLADGSLSSLVYAEPPFLVRDAVLGAWARLQIVPLLEDKGIDAALAVVQQSDPDIAMLVDKAMVRTADADVAATCALVAIARSDADLAAAFTNGRIWADGVASAIADRLAGRSDLGPELESDTDCEPSTEPETESGRRPASWIEWVAALEQGSVESPDSDAVASWPPAWAVDDELARAIDALPDLAEDSLISGVTALLETDDPEHPAPKTAISLISRYLLSERFDPGDLAAFCTLLQIVVRSSPNPGIYESLLGDIQSYAHQWVSVLNAIRVIDIADAVACGPVGDARDGFVSALLGPLNVQRSRLSATLRGLASIVADDLGLGFDWQVLDNDGTLQEAASAAAELAPRVLIYSLDSGTLARAKNAVVRQWPRAHIESSSDKVGNAALKQRSRNADIVVLATRRAAHAATGFIVSNAAAATVIGYADGSGSASMLRAIESAISEWSA